MRVALIFIYLCLLLVKGNDPAYAAISSAQVHAIHQDSHSGNINTDLICDDIEDEDPDHLSSRKLKMVICDAETFPSVLNYRYNSSKAASSFYGRITYKYILQRVLRV